MEDERGVDDLIDIADEIPETLGLSAGLTEIRATARGEGLSVTVDVHGMLVALDLGEAALEKGPAALAAEISRLSTEAGTRALHAGMRAIKAGTTPAVTAAVGDALALPPESEPGSEAGVAAGSGSGSADDAGDGPAAAATPPAPTRSRRRPAPTDDDEEGFVLEPVKD
ncbi:hypothetical protein [Amycolatopsis jiangsuensis]|uniref:YbaB/EbfC DNA-binding family protein n=1 Tax=Amycolatopsis jiangsuensis TaxID=1181879 RepID=A0A840ITF9_9PSEU|nr:hypothetical protein [Amycolatopsis jiangsuensis]MBB4684502.1 hypothetical protein [Amycolatopsis jiangsuensis]